MTDNATEVIVGVQQTIAAYSRFLDGRDMARCAALFTPDASMTVMGQVHEGDAAIRAWLDSLASSPPGIHMTSNTLVEVLGADEAAATSDVAYIKRDEAGWKVLVAGQYVDRLTRGPDGWQFSSRVINLS